MWCYAWGVCDAIVKFSLLKRWATKSSMRATCNQMTHCAVLRKTKDGNLDTMTFYYTNELKIVDIHYFHQMLIGCVFAT